MTKVTSVIAWAFSHRRATTAVAKNRRGPVV